MQRNDMPRLPTLSWLIMLLLVAASAQANETRPDEVQRRGAQVMPFDLEQTSTSSRKHAMAACSKSSRESPMTPSRSS